MHELSVVFEVIKSVERVVLENQLSEVEAIVLQVGEISTMIPKYLEECFPAAIDGTRFEKTKLEIEIVTAIGHCRDCGLTFKIVENQGNCPSCVKKNWDLVSGKEFLIKEIVAY